MAIESPSAGRARSPEDAETEPYRRLSGPAILGFVLGLLSILSLMHWFFWILPAASLAAGLIGLRHVRRSEDTVSGRGFAQLGLLFAVVFLAGGLATHFLPRIYQIRQARAAADAWFDALIRGGEEAAEPYMIPPPAPPELPQGAPPEMVEGMREARARAESERRDSPFGWLVEHHHEIEAVYEETDMVELRGFSPTIAFIYRVRYHGEEDSEPQALRVVVERTLTEDGSLRWRVNPQSVSPLY